MDILKLKLLYQLGNLLILCLHLLGEVGDNLLKLVALDRALANLLLQLIDKVLILLHHRLDELEVLSDTLLGVCSLS